MKEKYVKIPIERVVMRLSVDKDKYPPLKRRQRLLHIMKTLKLKPVDVARVIDVKANTVAIWACLAEREIPYCRLVLLYRMLGFDLETGQRKPHEEGLKSNANITRKPVPSIGMQRTFTTGE